MTSEFYEGDIVFSLYNPDGTTQFSSLEAKLSPTPVTIGIEGTPGTEAVAIVITIPGPLTINDDLTKMNSVLTISSMETFTLIITVTLARRSTWPISVRST